MVFRLQPATALSVALTFALVANTGHATFGAASRSALGGRKPTQQEQRAFRGVRAEMDEAGEQGNWDAFLAKAAAALEGFPEHETSRGARSEVVGLVGEWKVEQRSDAQVRLSAEILEVYTAQLREAYGDAAERLSESVEARGYVDALERRLENNAATSAPPAAEERAAIPPPIAPDADRRPRVEPNRRRSTAMIASGGALTGVGTVLGIVGGVFAGRWRNGAARYERLGDQQHACMCVAPSDEAASWSSWTDARAKTLGFAIPGVVLLGVGVGLLVTGIKARRTGSAMASRAVPTHAGVGWRF